MIRFIFKKVLMFKISKHTVNLGITIVMLSLVMTGCDNVNTTAKTVSSPEAIVQLNQAVDLYKTRRFEESAEAHRTLVEQYPDDSAVWSSYGFVLIELDRLDEAQAAFENSQSLKSDWADPYLGMGILARKNDNYDEAYSYYQTALKYNPNDGHVLGSMLTIQLRRGDFELAKEYGERAVALLPNDAVVMANLSIVYHYTEDFDKRDTTAKRAEALGYHNMQGIKDIFSGELTVGPE